MSSYKYDIPRRLDDPPKAFFWDFDVALVFSCFFVFGMVAGYLVMPSVLGALIASWYGKLKSGQSRGFGIHAMYWFTPINLGFKRTPPSALRHFIG